MALTFNEQGALLVTGLIGGSGAAGQVAYWTGVASLSGENALWWDAANDRLGVGTVAPGFDVHIYQATANCAIVVERGDTPVSAVMQALSDKVRIGARTNHPINFLISNVAVVYIDTTGYVGANVVTPTRRIHAMDDSASTGVIIPIARLESQVSGGAGAAGHGPGLELYGETSTTENTSMGQLAARWSVPTHASRRARLEMYAAYIGTDVLVGVVEAPATASVDGNSRGVGAVDLQGSRGAATQVASGNYSAIIAGTANTVSGVNSFAAAGATNTVSGDSAAAIGGATHVVSGDGAVALGGISNYATGDHTVVSGVNSLADKRAQVVSSGGYFSATGDAQGTIQMVVRRDVTTHVLNTWYGLWLDGISEQMLIPASTAWTFRALVVGITADAAEQWGYDVYGLIERDAAGNTTMAAYAVTTIFESDANYNCQAVADDATEALEIQVRRTGGADYSVQWVATVRTAEVTHT